MRGCQGNNLIAPNISKLTRIKAFRGALTGSSRADDLPFTDLDGMDGTAGTVAGVRRVTRGPKRAPNAQPLYRAILQVRTLPNIV